MKRLMEYTVFSGFTAACLRASVPTSRSPVLVNATTEGVVREPSAFGMTTGSPPSMTAMTELVVPRSIPTVFGICLLFLPRQGRREFQLSTPPLLPHRLGAETRSVSAAGGALHPPPLRRPAPPPPLRQPGRPKPSSERAAAPVPPPPPPVQPPHPP